VSDGELTRLLANLARAHGEGDVQAVPTSHLYGYPTYQLPASMLSCEFKDLRITTLTVEGLIDGVLYRGVLYPVQDEENSGE
jgi:hypothetical protein